MLQTVSNITNNATTRVLVVDDSAVIRQLLCRELAKDPHIQVVGFAPDAFAARDKIVALRPDVVTLDIQMPKMDGITFLRRLMEYHPIPVIVVSSLGASGAPEAIEAMAAGAVDVVAKPSPGEGIESFSRALAEKIKAARRARPEAAETIVETPNSSVDLNSIPKDTIFALGASTGGVQALTQILSSLPPGAPATLVVQHMPRGFTASFASRLDSLGPMSVKEAADGDVLRPGRVLIAPGGRHMRLRRIGAGFNVELIDAPEVNHQRPSIQVLFESIARLAPPRVVAALLTGMGNDGAAGLLTMRNKGARTIAQDESTSTVFGMPAEAIKCGAAEAVVPLHRIARTMLTMSSKRNGSSHG